MDSLPCELRDWVNGMTAITQNQLNRLEAGYEKILLDEYINDTKTKEEVNEAWNTWIEMRDDEINYIMA